MPCHAHTAQSASTRVSMSTHMSVARRHGSNARRQTSHHTHHKKRAPNHSLTGTCYCVGTQLRNCCCAVHTKQSEESPPTASQSASCRKQLQPPASTQQLGGGLHHRSHACNPSSLTQAQYCGHMHKYPPDRATTASLTLQASCPDKD
jgi:hypothetical protein